MAFDLSTAKPISQSASGFDLSTAKPITQPEQTSIAQDIGQGVGNLVAGAVRGAGSIGATILSPVDWAARQLNDGKPIEIGGINIAGQDRRSAMDSGLQDMGAQPDSMMFKGGKLAGEIAGTAGAGGAIANGVRFASAAPMAAKVASAIESGGFTLGSPAATSLGGRAADIALRAGGGAVSGGTMAGMANPEDAGMGAMLGGAIPLAGGAAGWAGSKLGKGAVASQATSDLYAKAQNQGIDIPADRLVNSPILNAISASLRYMPGSGRVATESAMEGQIKQALSKTIGEDTPNLTVEMIKQAKSKMGAQFDDTLRNNNVIIDDQLRHDLYQNLEAAKQEMGSDARLDSLRTQVDKLMGKAYAKDPMAGESVGMGEVNAGRPTFPDVSMAAGMEAMPTEGKIMSAIRARGGLHTSEMRDLVGEKATNKSGAQVGAFTKSGKELGDMAEQLVAERILPPSILEGNGGARNLGELIQKELNPTLDKNAAAYQAHLDEAPMLQGAYKGDAAGARSIGFEQSNEIGGKAAYDTKKVLDRLGNSSDVSLAHHARQIKASLMKALDRSLGDEKAANFAKLREQYGNVKALEPLIQNGAEGGVSMARLGNMKNIRSQDMQDIADIASQFARGRESPHGAMQRVAMGGMGATAALGGGAMAGLAVPVAMGLTAGRVANSALNSNALKTMLLQQKSGGSNALAELLKSPVARAALIQSR